MAAAGGACKSCPEDTFSTTGSIGLSKCLPRKPCTEDDYTHSFTECNLDKNIRVKSYYWKIPRICNKDKESGSVELPNEEPVPCRGCGRGEFRNLETDQCDYCPTGEF